MTRYLKFDNNGFCTGEAPKQMVKDGKLILGYNKPSNEEMLLADGYIRYDGNKNWFWLHLENGEIVDREKEETHAIKVFTKLQIRRALRKLGAEAKLDDILTGNVEFGKDWADAQEINLEDEAVVSALMGSDFDESFINVVIDNIE